jgi:hypothetical protein
VTAIKNRANFSEERVYQAIVNTNFDFVSVHFKDFNSGIKNELHAMFEEIHNEVEAGIWDGQYDVDKRNVCPFIFRIIFPRAKRNRNC